MECYHLEFCFPLPPPPFIFCLINFYFFFKRNRNYKQTVSCSFPRSFLDEYLLLNLNRQIKGKELGRF